MKRLSNSRRAPGGGLARAGLALGFVIASLSAVHAQPPQPPDWPCEQVLVPAVSAAVVWDGPAVDGLAQRWRAEPEVAELVAALTAPRLADEEAGRLIDAFAGGARDAERSARLTLLFAGVLETVNERRAEMISGIRRFARGQAKRATQISAKLAELAELRAREQPEAADEIAALEEWLRWAERIFDEREHSIRYLCEQPVALEETLGNLARAISARLE